MTASQKLRLLYMTADRLKALHPIPLHPASTNTELTHSDPPTPLERGATVPLRVPRLPQWRGFRRSPLKKGG
jgi:hypothetical protein